MLPLQKRIETLEAVQANKNEQYSQKYNLRLVGLSEEESENCTEKVVDFCKEWGLI